MCVHTHTEAVKYSEQVKRRAHLLLGNPSLLLPWLNTHAQWNKLWHFTLPIVCFLEAITMEPLSLPQQRFSQRNVFQTVCEIFHLYILTCVREYLCYWMTG